MLDPRVVYTLASNGREAAVTPPKISGAKRWPTRNYGTYTTNHDAADDDERLLTESTVK